jgi:2-(1,2-epoxy-1,2-dihydrophenyl)acetyl-CoA isomerase
VTRRTGNRAGARASGKRAVAGRAAAVPSAGARLAETRDGAIVTLTMSNPGKLNAMSLALRDALSGAFTRLNDDPVCRAIVLTGADGNFSAGADMEGWGETTLAQCRARLRRGGARLMREMIGSDRPIIAAVEGFAYGAGLALACAADHVVASSSARFCCAFTRVGFMPDMALLFSLPNRVGVTRAKQLIALAEDIAAPRAERLGLVDELVEPGQALARAQQLALRYAAGPPIAFALTKSVLARGLEAMIQAEIDLQPHAWLSADHEEGKRAFRARRRPEFKGR